MVLSSCASVTVKNQEWCGDKGPFGASCFNTLNKNKRTIAPEIWNKIAIGPDHRFGKVCTDASNFADTKAVILNLCEASKRCTYEAEQNIIKFDNNVQSFLREAKASIDRAKFIEQVNEELFLQNEVD